MNIAARADVAALPWRALWRDPVWLAALAVATLTSLPYVLPVFSPDGTWYYAVYYSDPPLLATILLILEISRRRAARRRERQFWGLWLAALACWMGNWLLFVTLPAFTEARSGELVGDLLNLLYYLFAFLAATTLPHLAGGDDAGAVTPQVLGTWLFGFFLMSYFVLVPVTLEPSIYASYVPSYVMYLTLDVLLVAAYARLAQLAGGSGWRRLYTLVAVTSVLWLALDVVEFLEWVETLPWVDAGTVLDVLWIPPYLPFVAAARLQALAPAATLSSAASELSPALSRRRSGRALLVVYTAAFPLVHFGSYASGLSEASIRQPRELCVFVAVLVLGSLAVVAHRQLEIERTRAEARVLEQKDRLRALSHRLACAQEDERRQVARELHDEIGQQLTGLRLSLGALRHRGGAALSDDLAEIEESFSELLRQVRELSLSLRPTMLDDHGLLPALTWLFKRLGEQTGLHVTLESLADFSAMSADAQLAVYRIIQESLTNIIRHAGVREAGVRLDADAAGYRIEIRDGGAGFSPEHAVVGTSCGIDGMHERAELVGGTLEVSSRPARGTRVTVSLPRA